MVFLFDFANHVDPLSRCSVIAAILAGGQRWYHWLYGGNGVFDPMLCAHFVQHNIMNSKRNRFHYAMTLSQSVSDSAIFYAAIVENWFSLEPMEMNNTVADTQHSRVMVEKCNRIDTHIKTGNAIEIYRQCRADLVWCFAMHNIGSDFNKHHRSSRDTYR